MVGFKYLASPYTKYPGGVDAAHAEVCWIAARLIKAGTQRRRREASDLQGVHRMSDTPKPPPELDAIARKVLGYHPKPKSEPAKKRQRARKKAEKARGRPNP